MGLKQNFGCIEELFSIVLKYMVYLVQYMVYLVQYIWYIWYSIYGIFDTDCLVQL